MMSKMVLDYSDTLYKYTSLFALPEASALFVFAFKDSPSNQSHGSHHSTVVQAYQDIADEMQTRLQ